MTIYVYIYIQHDKEKKHRSVISHLNNCYMYFLYIMVTNIIIYMCTHIYMNLRIKSTRF